MRSWDVPVEKNGTARDPRQSFRAGALWAPVRPLLFGAIVTKFGGATPGGATPGAFRWTLNGSFLGTCRKVWTVCIPSWRPCVGAGTGRKVKKYQPTERHYLDHSEGIRDPRGGGWGRSRDSFPPPPRKNLVKSDHVLQFLRGGGNPNPLLMVEIMSFCGLVLFALAYGGRFRTGFKRRFHVSVRPVPDQCHARSAESRSHGSHQCRMSECGVHVTMSDLRSHVGSAECHFGCTGVLTEIDEGNWKWSSMLVRNRSSFLRCGRKEMPPTEIEYYRRFRFASEICVQPGRPRLNHPIILQNLIKRYS